MLTSCRCRRRHHVAERHQDGKLLLVAAREDNYLHCVDMDTLTEWKLNMNANQDDHVRGPFFFLFAALAG
jgi:hypothetical protein